MEQTKCKHKFEHIVVTVRNMNNEDPCLGMKHKCIRCGITSNGELLYKK